MNRRFKTLLLATCITTMQAQTQAQTQTQEDNQSMLGSLNESLPGEFALEMKTVFMGRTRGDLPGQNDEQTSSTSLALGYTSDTYNGLSFGANYISSWVNYSGGSRNTALTPDMSLNLSRFNILNEAYINYSFDDQGLKNTYIRAGRQLLNLNFARGYNIRQKPQAFEGLIFHTEAIDDWSVTTGHLEKFSGWSSRDFYPRPGETARRENVFVDIEQLEGVSYSTSGFQFVEATYSGMEDFKLSFYDYYGDDLYNTFGVHADYSFHLGGWEEVVKARYLTQQDVGIFADEIDARAFQLGLQLKKDAFSFETGLFKVTGSSSQHNLRTPFQPDLIVEEPMFEVDLGFYGGSVNFYLESGYSWSDNSLYFLVLHTDADQATNTSAFADSNTEMDIIYGHNFSDNLYLKFKFAYSRFEPLSPGINEPWVADYRLFIGYRF